MNKNIFLTGCALWLGVLLLPVNAADTNPPSRLTLELRDGSRVVGESVAEKIKFHSALLGDLKLAVKDIRAVDCSATNAAKLTTANGDTLAVSFLEKTISIRTSFGKVEPAMDSIRKFTVTCSQGIGAHPPGLVALWAGEGDGKNSIDNNDLEPFEVTYADGQVGRAFVLNGRSSCLKLADTTSLNPGPKGDGLTMSAWIKPSNVNNYHPILEWNPIEKMPGIIGTQIWIGARPGDRGVLMAAFPDCNGTGHSLISPPGTVVAGRFQHIASTYDKTTGAAALYVNGVVVASAQWERFDPLTTGDFWISRRPTDQPGDWTYNAFYSGLLDEISIYNRALSADEIRAVCSAENHGELPPAPATGKSRGSW